MGDHHLERVRAQFTRTAEIYARLVRTSQEQTLSSMVAMSRATPSDHVLDVACGPGFLSMAFAEHCADVVGFDATNAFIELARAEAAKRGLRSVRFEHGDAEQLPFADGHFSIVSCRAAFHHFSHPARVLAEMIRVLETSGRIVVADLLGSEDPEQAKLHDHIEQLCDPTHVRALSISDFKRIFAAAGLRITAERHGTIDYDLEEWISHGAPEDGARREILSLMESCLADDRAGLRVRREGGRLRFSHHGAAFVLERQIETAP